ncbi:hypothetical protein MMC25_001216 [Agyrium rufum]|nr:hypothetical protein [Agyrium rufum]
MAGQYNPGQVQYPNPYGPPESPSRSRRPQSGNQPQAGGQTRYSAPNEAEYDDESEEPSMYGNRVGSAAGRQHDELFMSGNAPALPPPPRGGYYHQGSNPLPPLPPLPYQAMNQSSYNPQDYSTNYSPISIPQSNASPLINTGHTPYVPAAYSTANTPSTYSAPLPFPTPYGNTSYNSTSNYSPSAAASRPWDPYYGSQYSPQISNPSPVFSSPLSTHQSAFRQGDSQRQDLPALPARGSSYAYHHTEAQLPDLPPLPNRTTTSPYTPPAPPPPPMSPTSDAFPSNNFPAAPRAYTHSSSTARTNLTPPVSRLSTLGRLANSSNIHADNPSINSISSATFPSPPIYSSPGAPSPSLPGPTPPQHSPQRTITTLRHPQSRPLPGPPPESPLTDDYFGDPNASNYYSSDSHAGSDDLMREVEDAVMGRGGSVSGIPTGHSPRTERVAHPARINEEDEYVVPDTAGTYLNITPDTNLIHPNGVGIRTGSSQDLNDDDDSDESDLEAAAGLRALQIDEQQEASGEFRGHPGRGSFSNTPGSRRHSERDLQEPSRTSSGSEVGIDMTSFAGGFPGGYNYGYGVDPASLNTNTASYANYTPYPSTNGNYPPRRDQSRGSDVSSGTVEMPSANYGLSDDEALHPFPTFGARTDTGGTGGFARPGAQPRRLSFEDGDEATLVHYGTEHGSSESSSLRTANSSFREHRSVSPYHSQNNSFSRPLPKLPPGAISEQFIDRRQYDQFGRPVYPVAPDEYDQLHSATVVPVQKANSVGSHSTTPHVQPPGRSVTDAEQRRRMNLSGIRTDLQYNNTGLLDTTVTSGASLSLGAIDLPSIPVGKRKKFVPSKLTSKDFEKCHEPWALSSILAWIKITTEGETDLKEQPIMDCIVALFTNKVPTMNTAEAEVLSAKVVTMMLDASALIKEEEWVRFGTNPISGVLYQLTGIGCYSPRLHLENMAGRCYAHHCGRTLKKVLLQTQKLVPNRKVVDWADFYKLRKEDIEGRDSKDIERQNNLHEVITSEEKYMDDLNVLRLLYRDGLVASQNNIMPQKKLDKFVLEVFGKVDSIQAVNENYLLAQLKYRQQEQGPWITGFSDIFREWIRKGKQIYIEYAASFPAALLAVRKERDSNSFFRQFLQQVQENESSKRLDWDHYLKTPITRLQRYGLLLGTVLKNMVQDLEEKANLQLALDEIKAVTLECDNRVAENSKKTDLLDLQSKLQLRREMSSVKLNLQHLGREVIFRGDLQRRGANKVTWVDTHAILFDHFLVLAKPMQSHNVLGALKSDRYDVSKLPIPMDLLVLESMNDDPVVKNAVKGITAVPQSAIRPTTASSQFSRTISANGSVGPGTLTHTNTNSSVNSLTTPSSSRGIVPSTILDSSNERLLYPFRVKHLGKTDHYTLYASSKQNRQDWCENIIEAKKRHASSLFRQNAEPFKLKVLADSAFFYDYLSTIQPIVPIEGTPVDRAITEMQLQTSGTWPGAECRAAVNCATSFNRATSADQPKGYPMLAVGTDYGVFITEYGNPRGWRRIIIASKVTQIAVLEEFSIFLLISDRVLIAHHLDTIVPVNSNGAATKATTNSTSLQRAPQKLSGSRDVGFFRVGRMKDRTLVFYKKRDGISSTFRVLEPVFQRSSQSSRTRHGFRRGQTDYFRDFDEFYIPSQTYAVNLFDKSLAIATEKGFEVLTLDKKLPLSIPDLKATDVAPIAARIKDQKPLGMFRLNDTEFLLVFEEVAIYVNKHGDVSRSVVMEFVGRAKQAALYGGTYLILIDEKGSFVEVRNADNGRLRQIISGREVKLLDDGRGVQGALGTVKICMQHPDIERSQVIFELSLNEGLKE